MKPVILLTGEQTYMSGIKAAAYTVNKAYAQMISSAGGIAVCAVSFRFAQEYASLADGLVLTGGSHIHPGHYHDTFYGKTYSSNYMRDEAEINLFSRFLEQGKPILGIGRGMQIINVVMGGTLTQNLVEQKGVMHNVNSMHHINTKENSLVARIYGSRAEVNSHHDMGIDRLGKGLKVTARSDDDVVEAIEMIDKPVFGVQFHPEQLGIPGDRENKSFRFFEAFIDEIYKKEL